MIWETTGFMVGVASAFAGSFDTSFLAAGDFTATAAAPAAEFFFLHTGSLVTGSSSN